MLSKITTCSVEGCEKRRYCRGWCSKHYQRWLRCGDTANHRLKHGAWHTPIYSIWTGMVARCSNRRHTQWKDYGGRGITVCDRWNPKAGGSFANFLADMGERSEGLSVDRIDNDGNYEPGNCRWATAQQQNSNRRSRYRTRLTHNEEAKA